MGATHQALLMAGSAYPGLTADPYFTNVGLLLRSNGPNGGTTFTDESSFSRTVTRTGTPTISTAESKYGGGSAHVNSAGCLTVSHDTSIDMVTGDFTLEFWLHLESTTTYYILMLKANGVGFYPWLFWVTPDYKVQFRGWDNTGPTLAYNLTTTTVLSAGNWYHIAGTRSGNDFRLFLDGVLEDSSTFSGTLFSSTANVAIGGYDNGTNSTAGYMDDIRVTKGVARYTAAFTPPLEAAPF